MEVLLRIWVGHSTEGITDKYTVETLKRDLAYRKATAEQAGLGFRTPLEHQLPVARIAPRMYASELRCKCLVKLVGERGFEPPTPWSRTRCSTRLSHSPTVG